MKIEISEDNAKTLAELAAKSNKTPEAYLNDYLAIERERLEKIRRDETEDGFWRIYISSKEYPQLDGIGSPLVFHNRHAAERKLPYVACCLSNQIQYYLDADVTFTLRAPDGIVRRDEIPVASARVADAGTVDSTNDGHFVYRHGGGEVMEDGKGDVDQWLCFWLETTCREIADKLDPSQRKGDCYKSNRYSSRFQ